MEITCLSSFKCDGYHTLLCSTARLMRSTIPTMNRMESSAHSGKGMVAGKAEGSRLATQTMRPRPLQVTWEITRARGSKAGTKSKRKISRDLEQFSTAEAFHLIEEVAAMHVPLLALTGGDPLARPDLFPIIAFASNRSVRTSLTLIPTLALQPGIVAELKASGLMRAGFWLHGSTPSLNDSYSRTA